MALVRTLWNAEYWPDFSAIVVRDGVGSDEDNWGAVPVGLHAYEIDMGLGTAGLAGTGEFMVSAGDGPHRVRLEVYDAPAGPPDDGWPQVMETPYRSPTGTVGLSNMTDGPALETVDLLGRGSYRLQVCSRWEGDQGVWLLRWWPCSPEEPLRWVRRDPSPYLTADSLAEDIAAAVAWSPGLRLSCTVAELASRLLVSVVAARAAVNRAIGNAWLELDGDLSSERAVTLRVGRDVSLQP